VKAILLLLFGSTALFAQPFSFGFKAGVPVTDFLSATSNLQGAVSAGTSRYILGPEAELRLPFGIGVEFDILYRHFDYSAGPVSASASSWEFPLLARKLLLSGPVRPFADAGVTFSKLTGLSQAIQTLAVATGAKQNDSPRGFTLGGGVELHFLNLRVAPELRYTRWGSQALDFILPGGSLSANQNQAEFLVGVTF
jgi:opacity protein-like surface antigen